jgi:FkbM family methyltransferase
MKYNAIFYKDFENSYIPHILRELYIDKVYDRFLMGRKDITLLDIGANIGLFSMYAYPMCKTIHAIEPCKEHCDTIKKNMDYNGIKNVNIHQIAIANKNGEMTLHHSDNKTAHNLLVGGDGEVVKTKTLDVFFEENKIKHVDFIKLDIEGSEFEVLGGEGFAKVADKIDTIVGEIHSWAGINYNQIRDSLEQRGFRYRDIKADASIFVAERL